MSRLRLITKPNPLLYAKNAEIKFPLSSEIRALIDQMFFAVKKHHGVGLAAPQIGKNLRLAVINLADLELPVFAIINPQIISASKNLTLMEEGCLSIPRKFGQVARPEEITVKFQNQEGKTIKTKLESFVAKVFQHEIDHLNGGLIDSKWDPKTVHEASEEELKKIRARRIKKIHKDQ